MSDSENSGSEKSQKWGSEWSDVEPSRFNSRTQKRIRALYDRCCTFCLTNLSQEAMVCTEILDASSEEGASQVAACSQLNIIPHDYQRQSLENGFLLCLVCYPLFRNGHLALYPPDEVLDYLTRYVRDTPVQDQIPLYQILHELTNPNPQLEGLPDTSAIQPYVGLYTIAHLHPSKLQNYAVLTPFSPPLSILRSGQWENAPNQIAPNDQNLAQIYDLFAPNASDLDLPCAMIPIHPDHRDYSSVKRYWRLQYASLGGILSAAILCSESSVQGSADELKKVRALHDILKIRKAGGIEGLGDGGGRG